MMRCARLFLISVLLVCSTPVSAVDPDEILSDPVLEGRARNLSTELRCLVCQNQSIDDSDAPLAKDLRVLIRQRLSSGDSDNQVVDFVVARYGEFVLLRPRFAPHTWALWLGAPVILILGIALIVVSFRRRRQEQSAGQSVQLTAKEQESLKRLMDEG